MRKPARKPSARLVKLSSKQQKLYRLLLDTTMCDHNTFGMFCKLCLPSALWPVLSRIDRCVHKIHNILFHKRWTVTHTKASRLHIALYTAEECNLHSCRVHLKFMSIHLQSSTKGHEYKIFHHTSPLSSFNEDLMPERQTFRASDTIK